MKKFTMMSLACLGSLVVGLTSLFAQSATSFSASDRVSIAYVPPDNSGNQAVYELLHGRGALEKIKEILNPLRLPEALK
jgi:hypothetical protein